mgnify:CR=1 FL=1
MSMSTLLMCGNEPVLRFNITEGIYDVLNSQLLPFVMKDYLRHVKSFDEVKSKYDDTQRTIAMNSNRDAVINWLSHRTLLLTRKNAKKLYNSFGLVQRDDEITRAKMAIACKALSILDNYWIKSESASDTWDSINLRHNHLSEAISQIALHGTTPFTIDGTIKDSYEFLTNGASAKCWKRREDGSLWMYKAGDNGTFEAKVEIAVSNILDRCNVAHCHYEEYYDSDLFVSACPAMTNDDISIVDGDDFISYCHHHELNPDKELVRIDADSYYKMFIVDYLIANRDRHTQNWGMYYDPKTTELISMHPLFDHNNAFDVDCMQNKNFPSHFLGKSLKENALYAIRNCDFHFTGNITRDLFVTEKHYECFMRRADELNISQKAKSNPLLGAADSL